MSENTPSLSDMRREYSLGALSRESLHHDPLVQFDLWLKDAIAANIPDPTAMTIATVDSEGQPSQRIVLLKDVDQDGFVFYTNLESRKAKELSVNPKISLHFPWHFMERQIRIGGVVSPLSADTVENYFLSRPKASQLAAWASAQSHPIKDRQALLNRFEKVTKNFSDKDISLPEFWGGYKVTPHEMEFWQGGEHRLHDRFEYKKDQTGRWGITRLMP